MNWKDKKCLVTGAGGFIGSHLLRVLDYFSDRRRASEVLALINKKLDDDQV